MPRAVPRHLIRRQIKTRRWRKPKLSIAQILAWADEHHQLTGHWPTRKSGRVEGTLEEDWNNLDNNLRQGDRGLLKGDSLARLLWRERGVRNPADPPPLCVDQILAWADAHHQRHGQWPIADSGAVIEEPDESWTAIDMALRVGSRGLSGSDSLARLLARERGVPNKQDLPRLSVRQILNWVDQYHDETGKWPNDSSAAISVMNGASWIAIDAALRTGNRGLPGGDSLPQLLARERGVRNIHALPPLSIKQILEWADDHFRRTGGWPARASGAVLAEPGENWMSIDNGLQHGLRGLPGGDSLIRLLARRRGARNRKALPPYTVKQILRWADDYLARHDRWPTQNSGPIDKAPGETWTAVAIALSHGNRGLPGGDSLARLLARHRKKRNRGDLPSLKIRRILDWADAHFARTGVWPTQESGPIADAPGETWMAVDQALYNGIRGLPGGSSLFRLLARHRGIRRHVRRPQLTVARILDWADAYFARQGRWPDAGSGAIPEAPGETWSRVQTAFYQGKRGLPPGLSLSKVLSVHRGVRSVQHLPPLSEARILRWADEYYRAHRRWPSRAHGSIEGTDGETWNAVDMALKKGHRGLAGGDSLAALLDRRRRKKRAAKASSRR